MDTEGLQLRALHMYLDKPSHYAVQFRFSHAEIYRKNVELVKKFVPERFHGTLDTFSREVPRAYPVYKGKCLQLTPPCFCCTKSHQHERDITADHLHIAKKFMQKAARACRLAKLCSTDKYWTLANMSEVSLYISKAYEKLRIVPCFEHECPCGRKKDSCLTMVRCDASSFFSNASMVRRNASSPEEKIFS